MFFLFNAKQQTFFYSKSMDAKPGHGANESSYPNDDFKALQNHKNWRRCLSIFHVWHGTRGMSPKRQYMFENIRATT